MEEKVHDPQLTTNGTTEVIQLRKLPPARAAAIRSAAKLRGLTLSDYVQRLYDLHKAVRARADAGDDALQAELEALGLQSVHE